MKKYRIALVVTCLQLSLVYPLVVSAAATKDECTQDISSAEGAAVMATVSMNISGVSKDQAFNDYMNLLPPSLKPVRMQQVKRLYDLFPIRTGLSSADLPNESTRLGNISKQVIRQCVTDSMNGKKTDIFAALAMASGGTSSGSGGGSNFAGKPPSTLRGSNTPPVQSLAQANNDSSGGRCEPVDQYGIKCISTKSFSENRLPGSQNEHTQNFLHVENRCNNSIAYDVLRADGSITAHSVVKNFTYKHECQTSPKYPNGRDGKCPIQGIQVRCQ